MRLLELLANGAHAILRPRVDVVELDLHSMDSLNKPGVDEARQQLVFAALDIDLHEIDVAQLM
jgi:hypothetical protein